MAAWRRCDGCRKVLPEDAYDGDGGTCLACLAGPTPKVRAARSSAVTTTRSPGPAAPVVPPSPRGPLLGKTGSGDLEVRERRARRAALDQLAELHGEEFEQLMAVARRSEGLRA